MLSNANTLRLMGAREVFKDNLKKKMYEKGVRAVDVCNALKINKTTYSSWVIGRALPSPIMLEQLCKYFECSAEELLQGKKEEPQVKNATYIEQLEKIISYFKDGLITIDEYNLLKSKLMEELK